MTANRNLGSILRSRRRTMDAGQMQIAHDVGISQAYLSLIENGKRRPPWRMVLRLANVLKLSPRRLRTLWLAMDGTHD